MGDDEGGLTRGELLRRAAAGGVLLAAPGVVAACGGEGGQETGTEAARRGGRLRFGLSGGATETLDAHKSTHEVDIARVKNLYDRLADFDPKGRPIPALAEELEPNESADAWTIKLRRGVTFHNGKEMTADDVVYSYLRNLDPKEGLQGAADVPFLSPKGVRKVDKYT
ncbi:MAG: ABC transporter substrate-binding protein, partial [Vicinamibacteria bacterium]